MDGANDADDKIIVLHKPNYAAHDIYQRGTSE